MELEFVILNTSPYLNMMSTHFLSKCNTYLYKSFIDQSIDLLLEYLRKKKARHDTEEFAWEVYEGYPPSYATYEDAIEYTLKLEDETTPSSWSEDDFDYEADFWEYVLDIINIEQSEKLIKKYKSTSI